MGGGGCGVEGTWEEAGGMLRTAFRLLGGVSLHRLSAIHIQTHTSLSVCVCVYMYIRMYVCICIRICMYIYTIPICFQHHEAAGKLGRASK